MNRRRLAVFAAVAALILGACSSSSEYPAWEGVDLDCDDVGHSVVVDGADPHGLDRDGDGIGCE